jgi:hypothetical protein
MLDKKTIDKTSRDLVSFLEKEIKPLLALTIIVVEKDCAKEMKVTIDGEVLIIYVTQNGIRLQCSSGVCDALPQFNSLLTNFNSGCGPNFSYLLVTNDSEAKSYKVYEWTINEYEWPCYAKLISNSRYYNHYKTYNVVSLKNKVPPLKGIYPGKLLIKANVMNASSEELFWLIYILKSYLNGDLPIKDKSIEDITYAIEYCINQLRRFGLQLPDPQEGVSLDSTPDFKNWYKQVYDSHFKNMDVDKLELCLKELKISLTNKKPLRKEN